MGTVVYTKDDILKLKPKGFDISINGPSAVAAGGTERNGKVRYPMHFMDHVRTWPASNQQPDVPPAYRKLLQPQMFMQQQGQQQQYMQQQQPQMQHQMHPGPPRRSSSNQNLQPRGRGRGRPSNFNQNQPNWGGGPQHGGPPHNQNNPKVIMLPKKDVKLHKTENSWKPEVNKRTTDTNRAKEDDEAMTKVANGILNKISPKTFETLSAKLLACGITTEARLVSVLGLLFAKALDQEFFGGLYAQICWRLDKLETKNPIGERINFSDVLRKNCQKEFERVTNTDSEADLETQSKLSKEDQKFLLNKKKRHLMGYMKFVGELFKVGVIAPKIVSSCVDKLLQLCEIDQEYAECLVKLLTTVGPSIDLNTSYNKEVKAKACSALTKWLGLLETKKVLPNVSIRVRFSIENLVDIRLNKWAGHSRSGELKVMQKDIPQQQRGATQPTPSPKKTQPSTSPSSQTAKAPITILQRNNATTPTTSPSKPNTSHHSHTSSPNQVPTTKQPKDIEKLKRKTDTILKEFISSTDKKEATLCLQELSEAGGLHVFLDRFLMFFLDTNDKDRKGVMDFFTMVLAFCTHTQIKEAVANVVKELDDIQMDIPKAHQHLGDCIARWLESGVATSDLLDEQIYACDCKMHLIASVVGSVKSEAIIASVVALGRKLFSDESEFTQFKEQCLQNSPKLSTYF